MAMKPFTDVRYGISRFTDRYGGITITAGKTAYTHQLSGVITHSGDYHTPTSHAFTVHDISHPKGSVVRRFPDGSSESSDGCGVASVLDSGAVAAHAQFATWIMDAAYVKLYERVRQSVTSMDRDVNISTDLVTWRETVRMVASWKGALQRTIRHADQIFPRAQAAQNALDRLNKGNLARDQAARYVRAFESASKEVASRHLEYIYGIAPTISTFHDLASLATTPPRRHGGLIKCEGYFSTREIIQYNGYDKPPSVCQGSYQERARCVAYFSPPDSVLQSMSAIGSLNIASTLYELTPHSFVLDWFTNTGEWMRSLETAYAHRNTFTTGYAVQGLIVAEDGNRAGKYQSYEYNVRRSTIVRKFRRQPLGGLPIPMTPSRRFNFNLSQQLASLSLVRQKLSVADDILNWRRRLS